MANNMNCESCSANARNMMHQREMMYQKDMRMPRPQMNTRNMNCNCEVNEPCVQPRMRERCDEDCNRGRDMLYGMPLAMGYVPWQNFECTYEPAQALKVGTIFPELDKPFYGRRGVRL